MPSPPAAANEPAGAPRHPRPATAEGPAQGRIARAAFAGALSVAARFARAAGAGRAGGRLHGRRQARQHRRAVSLQACGRRAGAGQGRDRRAGRGHRRLRPRPRHVAGLQRTAQRRVRQGQPARRAPHRAVGLPPCPLAVLALSSRTAHRRAGPRDRARHRRHRFPLIFHAVQRRADGDRDPAGLRDPVAALRLAVRRRHLCHDPRLRRLHLLGHRLARALPPRDERAQQRGQHQGRSTAC